MQKHLIIALKSFYISKDFKQKRHDRNIFVTGRIQNPLLLCYIFEE